MNTRATTSRLRWTGAALLLVCVSMLGVGCGEEEPQAPSELETSLRTFLERGPSKGLWEVKRLDERRRAYFAPLRGDDERLLMAPAPSGPDASFCKTCRHPCSYTRTQVTQFFFDVPPALFFENFKRESEVQTTKLDDGTPAHVATWVPRHLDGDLLTSRDVWFDPDSGVVLQIEDYSRAGHLIRRVLRLTDDTGEWDPATFDPETDPICAAPCPSCRGTPDEMLAEVCESASYPIVLPGWVPLGYQLVRAAYKEIPVAMGATENEDDDTIVPVRITSLLYSDGMGLISIGMAPPAEMDLIEARFAAMRRERDDAEGDGGVCPTSGVEPPFAGSRGGRSGDIVRWRTDMCRTVARRDGPGPLSVTLLGRNEVSGDDYMKVIESLAPYAPKTGDTADGETDPR